MIVSATLSNFLGDCLSSLELLCFETAFWAGWLYNVHSQGPEKSSREMPSQCSAGKGQVKVARRYYVWRSYHARVVEDD